MGSMAMARSASTCYGHGHGAKLGRVVGADAPGDHQRREQRRDFAQGAETRAPAEQTVGAVAFDDGRGLDHHDATHEQRRYRDDWHRT